MRGEKSEKGHIISLIQWSDNHIEPVHFVFQDQQSLHESLSGSNDNLSENSKVSDWIKAAALSLLSLCNSH